jgi:hypothetical protein
MVVSSSSEDVPVKRKRGRPPGSGKNQSKRGRPHMPRLKREPPFDFKLKQFYRVPTMDDILEIHHRTGTARDVGKEYQVPPPLPLELCPAPVIWAADGPCLVPVGPLRDA